MAQDFKANQIRTSQIIVSGSNSSNAGLLIYGSSSANNAVGGYPASLRTGVGSDVLVFVSGSRAGSAKSLFGGSVFVSGTLTINDQIIVNGDVGSNLLPDNDMQRNLGSPAKRFANVYTGDLHLRNDRGDYTLIEEEACLTIRFNKTGKRYKFVLEPAPEFDE